MIPIPAIIIIALGVLICAYLIISLYKSFDIAIKALEHNENKTNLVEMEVNNMTNEEAKVLLQKMMQPMPPRSNGKSITCLMITEAFNIAIKALEQTRWIPVSEDLPKDHDWYLAVFKEKDTGFQLIPRVAGYCSDGTWIMIDEDAMCTEYRDLLECVAWTRLPKPYKAESEE